MKYIQIVRSDHGKVVSLKCSLAQVLVTYKKENLRGWPLVSAELDTILLGDVNINMVECSLMSIFEMIAFDRKFGASSLTVMIISLCVRFRLRQANGSLLVCLY